MSWVVVLVVRSPDWDVIICISPRRSTHSELTLQLGAIYDEDDGGIPETFPVTKDQLGSRQR